uniref:KH domain-containing protein n=1 Tax=Mesocestoides corti TaxID=53468 RepID=A0A5K3EKV4_MESCO
MEENNEGFPRVCDASLPSPQEGSSRKTSDTIYLKVLVPSVAAGAIIGKNGEAIGQMQKETGAKIKLSKLNDFYPGTTERVCLIQGPLAGVRAMHSYIMERILEKPEVSSQAMTPTGTVGSEQAAEPAYISPPAYVLSRPSGAVWPVVYGSGAPTAAVGGQQPPPPPPAPPISGNRLLWERHKQVKILVPNCTAGLVIGKQGSYVSEIKEATGAFIQISQKSKEINLPERCITIAGELDQLRAAVDMVLTKIAEDPQSGTCPNISYSHTQGPVASAYPTGSPFAYNPTLQAQPIVSSRHSTPIVRQKSDGSGAVSMGGAYYHAALQATYLAAAAADYQQRLLAAGYHHRPHRGDGQSGDASGGSSSLESGGGGGANYGAPITPPSEQETPPFFTAPLLPAAAAGQMILHPSPSSPYELTPRFAFFQPNSSAGTTATGGVYASAGLESPPAPIVESAAFPLVASPPPQSSGPHHAFGGGGGVGGASAAFFPSTSAYAVRASPPLSYAGTTAATTTTAAWLRTRGFSEDAVAEITHAISTLSAHGVLNFRTVTSTDPMLITTAPVASMSQPPPIGPASQQQQQQQQQQQAPGVDVEGMEGEADFPGNNSTDS